VAAGAISLFAACQTGDDRLQGGGDPAAGPVTVPVERVVDGDTIVVEYEGDNEYVRYIGIDTPESVRPDTPVECFGEESSEANSALVGSREARLEFGPELRDRFGRLLAYVFVSDLMVNAELLRRGYAQTLTIPPNDARSGLFARLEREAREAELGLWGTCG
jgi:micrococcal nuclease